MPESLDVALKRITDDLSQYKSIYGHTFKPSVTFAIHNGKPHWHARVDVWAGNILCGKGYDVYDNSAPEVALRAAANMAIALAPKEVWPFKPMRVYYFKTKQAELEHIAQDYRDYSVEQSAAQPAPEAE